MKLQRVCGRENEFAPSDKSEPGTLASRARLYSKGSHIHPLLLALMVPCRLPRSNGTWGTKRFAACSCRLIGSDGGCAMAQVGEDQVEVQPGEVVVERKVIPARHGAFSQLLAVVVMLAFVATCIVVFAGSHLGLREQFPIEKAAESIVPQPTPAAP
jgi:hypothetical protein